MSAIICLTQFKHFARMEISKKIGGIGAKAREIFLNKQKENYMKKMVLLIGMLVVMALCAPLRASAADGKSFYVVGKAGAALPADNGDFDTGFTGEIGFGWDVAPKDALLMAIEFTVGYNTFSGDYTGDVPTVAGPMNVKIHLNDDAYPIGLTLKIGSRAGRLAYYGGIGVDVIPLSFDASASFIIPGDIAQTTIKYSNSDRVFGGHVLMGLTFDFTDSIFAGIEAKYVSASHQRAVWYGQTIDMDPSSFTVQGMIGFRF